jgi:hypothetical protein
MGRGGYLCGELVWRRCVSRQATRNAPNLKPQCLKPQSSSTCRDRATRDNALTNPCAPNSSRRIPAGQFIDPLIDLDDCVGGVFGICKEHTFSEDRRWRRVPRRGSATRTRCHGQRRCRAPTEIRWAPARSRTLAAVCLLTPVRLTALSLARRTGRSSCCSVMISQIRAQPPHAQNVDRVRSASSAWLRTQARIPGSVSQHAHSRDRRY